MKINGFLDLNKLYIKVDNEIFKEGALIEGEVLDILGDTIVIDVEGLGIIEAHTEKNLEEQKGKLLTFMVKSSLPNKIELKPIFDNIEQNNIEEKEIVEFADKAENYLKNILKEFNIKDDTVSIKFLDSLIKYNVKIKKENITNGIKVFDKLEQILNLDDEEIIILANPKEENLHISKEDNVIKEQNININKENIDVGKEDIRNFIVVNKDDNNSKNDLSKMLKEYLQEPLDNKVNINIIKTISFFIKCNIKPTINNIRYFLRLNEDLDLFSEDFKILEEIIDKKFTNSNKKAIINKGNINENSKNLIEETANKYKRTLEKITDYVKENSLIEDKTFKEDIEEIRNKAKFLNEMNKELTFIYLPLNLKNNKHDDVIAFLKKKKRKNDFNNKINIFINLNTKSLGNVKIYCEALNDSINVKFSDINKEDLSLFESKEDELKILVESTGYKITSIEYSFDKCDNILDSLIVNTNPIYYLDVQV